MEALARWLGTFLAPILTPIITKALNDFFSDKAFTSKTNPDLQSELDNLDGLERVRNAGVLSPARNSDPERPVN